MEIDEVASERVWLAVSPAGEHQKVVLRVSAPVRRVQGDWICATSLGALDARTEEIAGMDTWQAMQLATAHVAARIRAFESDGWKFFFWGSKDPTSYSDLLPAI